MRGFLKPVFFSLLWTPFAVLAAVSDLDTLFSETLRYANAILPVLGGIATIIFIWGVVVYIAAAGNEDKRSDGRQKIIYGLIGLFVLIAFWGIVNFVDDTLGLSKGAPTLPVLPR